MSTLDGIHPGHCHHDGGGWNRPGPALPVTHTHLPPRHNPILQMGTLRHRSKQTTRAQNY